MSTTLQDVLKQVEDLETYRDFTHDPTFRGRGWDNPDLMEQDKAYCNGAKAAFDALRAYLLSRIEHDRGRG